MHDLLLFEEGSLRSTVPSCYFVKLIYLWYFLRFRSRTAGKPNKIERWNNTFLVLVYSWDLLTMRKRWKNNSCLIVWIHVQIYYPPALFLFLYSLHPSCTTSLYQAVIIKMWLGNKYLIRFICQLYNYSSLNEFILQYTFGFIYCQC